MWPFRGIMPARAHESCARRFAEVEERLAAIELTAAERNLQVLELAERVAERLRERVRKRIGKAEEDGDDLDRLIALRRGGHGVR
jgi:hypothetical protein